MSRGWCKAGKVKVKHIGKDAGNKMLGNDGRDTVLGKT